MTEECLSVFNQEVPTNEDIVIDVTPTEIISKYIIRVYNENTLVDIIKVTGNIGRKVALNSTGNYRIKLQAYDKYSREYNVESGWYIIDKDAPTLRVGESVLTLSLGDRLDVMSGVIASDNLDGILTEKVTSNYESLDLSMPGVQKLTYTVTDSAGNTASKTVTLNILEKNTTGLFFIQFLILTILICIIIFLLKYRKTMSLEKRFGKFSVEPLEDKNPSLFQRITNFYFQIVRSLSIVVKKSVFLTRYAKHFDKYLIFTSDRYSNSIDIVSSKLLISFIFLLIAVISKALQYSLLSLYEMCFPMIIGFFVLDIIYMIKYKFYKERIENDLLQAIIIMNNAFKSGRSIVQAIELVGDELAGVIGREFRKMRKELSNGLTVDVVFNRFSERVNIEEVTYLTASLSILNKTDGNIIKVFSSIEHSLFMKKKLKLELNSLTGSSKIIMWVLFLVPFVFIVVISLLSPGYFLPFFSNPIGIILFFVMIIYYIVYVIAVRSILKVRM